MLLDRGGNPCVLGSGSYGRTFKARHLLLGTAVAIKVIRKEVSASESVRQRFPSEGRALVRLAHDHIALLRHFGQSADGELCYAMDFCGGGTLAERVQRLGPRPPGEALEVARQACQALAAAHGAGIIHRDLKPGNIMLAHRPPLLQVKVIDFGLAQPSGGDGGSGFRGTAQWASPEQLLEQPLDARSNLSSLGLVLWYLIDGSAPDEGDTAAVVKQRLAPEGYTERLPAEVPREVRDLLAQLLETDPGRRHESAADLLDSLDSLCREHPYEPVDEEQQDTSLTVADELPHLSGGVAIEERYIRLTRLHRDLAGVVPCLFPLLLDAADLPEEGSSTGETTGSTIALVVPELACDPVFMLAALLYRMIAGREPATAVAHTPAAYIQISGISEKGNRVLRKALGCSGELDSCASLVRAIANSESVSLTATGSSSARRLPAGAGTVARVPVPNPPPMPEEATGPPPEAEPEPTPEPAAEPESGDTDVAVEPGSATKRAAKKKVLIPVVAAVVVVALIAGVWALIAALRGGGGGKHSVAQNQTEHTGENGRQDDKEATVAAAAGMLVPGEPFHSDILDKLEKDLLVAAAEQVNPLGVFKVGVCYELGYGVRASDKVVREPGVRRPGGARRGRNLSHRGGADPGRVADRARHPASLRHTGTGASPDHGAETGLRTPGDAARC